MHEEYGSPDNEVNRNVGGSQLRRDPAQTALPEHSATPNNMLSASKPKVLVSASKPAFAKKGAGLFGKPNMNIKKKFTLADAGPTQDDLETMKKLEKVENAAKMKFSAGLDVGSGNRDKLQIVKQPRGLNPSGSKFGLTKDSVNQASTSSFSKKLDDKMVAPLAMVKKTKQDLAFYKENPRPPSSIPNKKKLAQDSDDYSDDDNYDENFDEDVDDNEADLKLEKLRKAMAREAQKATKIVQKKNI